MDKLSRYLGIQLKKEEIEAEKFDDIVYKRKPKERKKNKSNKRSVAKKIGKTHMKKVSKKKKKKIQRTKTKC